MKKVYTEPAVVVVELKDMTPICGDLSKGVIQPGGLGNGIPSEAAIHRSGDWDAYEN